MTRDRWVVGVALIVTGSIIALSLFLMFVGSLYSEASVTRQCSIANQCTDTQQFRGYFVPEPLAVIPLLLGALIGSGLVTRRTTLAWVGTMPLLVFSFLSIFSIGLFFAPPAVALVGFLGMIQNHKPTV